MFFFFSQQLVQVFVALSLHAFALLSPVFEMGFCYCIVAFGFVSLGVLTDLAFNIYASLDSLVQRFCLCSSDTQWQTL